MNLLVCGSLLFASGAAWSGLLLNLVFKSLLLLAAALGITALAPASPAVLRSRVWTLVFCLLLVMPLAEAFSPHVEPVGMRGPIIDVLQVDAAADTDPGRRVAAIADGSTALDVPHMTAVENAAAPHAPASSAASYRLRFPHWAFVVVLWLLGVAWLAVRTARCYYLGVAAARSARPMESTLFDRIKQQSGIRRAVGLRVSEEAPVPFVTGIAKTVIVLPATLVDWDANDLNAVLRHELAHVRRHDLLRLIVCDLVCAIYWFNPLVRVAAKRAALAAEMACDEDVCVNDVDPAGYARRLLWFATRGSNAHEPMQTPRMPGRSGVERRIRYILDAGTRSPRRISPARRLAARGVPAISVAILLTVMTLQIVATGKPTPVEPDETASFAPGRSEPESVSPGVTGDESLSELFAASRAGNTTAVARILATNPGDLDSQTSRGMTPLALAAWNDHMETVEYLLARGADPDVKNDNGLTPLFCAVDRGRYRMARLLVRGGADLDTRGYHGRTLLHMAARSGDADLVRTLVERGAAVNATDARGVTPLDLAAWHGKPSVASVLNGYGAVRSGTTPPVYLGRKSRKSTT